MHHCKSLKKIFQPFLILLSLICVENFLFAADLSSTNDKIIQWHEESFRATALLFASFCKTTYQQQEDAEEISGWQRVRFEQHGCDVFFNTQGEIVFAFAGTQLFNLDHIDRTYEIMHGEEKFLTDMTKFIDEELAKHHGVTRNDVYICGHSSGGYLANLLAFYRGFNSISFDSPAFTSRHLSARNASPDYKQYEHYSFVSHPNVINSFGSHHYDLHYIASDLDREMAVQEIENLDEATMKVVAQNLAAFWFPSLGYKAILDTADTLIANFHVDDLRREINLLHQSHSIESISSALTNSSIIKIAKEDWQSTPEKFKLKSFVFVEQAKKIREVPATPTTEISNDSTVSDGHQKLLLSCTVGIFALFLYQTITDNH